jgi:hypothetical protein
VKVHHRQDLGAKSTSADEKVDKFEAGESFVMVSGPFLMDRSLTDAERVYLIVLESWAWDKDHCWPGNAQIASRCGWLLPNGKPASDKAQRIGQRLEAKGRIRRVVVISNGEHSRERIVITGTRAMGTAKMPYGTSDLPYSTAEMPHPYGNNATPVGQICRTPTAKVPPELDSAFRRSPPDPGAADIIHSGGWA